jgi:hypothetical protein
MIQRGRPGRKPNAEYIAQAVADAPRPQPSGHYKLSKEARVIWDDVMKTVPLGYIQPSMYGILASYCRYKSREAELAQYVEQQLKKKDMKEYRSWARAERSVSIMTKSLGNALRLNLLSQPAREKRRELNRRQHVVSPLSKITSSPSAWKKSDVNDAASVERDTPSQRHDDASPWASGK